MDKIIVTGGNHHNTYGVIRSLGQKGVKPFLLLIKGNHDSFLLKSKYLGGYKVVDDEKNAVLYLQNNKSLFEGSVIITCSDGMSSALDTNRDSLVDCYKLPGASKQGRITFFMDKETMSNKGKFVGFNVPDSWLVSAVDDITNITYPCITKPILSKDGLKSDILICHNKQELVDFIKKGSCHSYQVQKFIEKQFEYQLIGLSINSGDEVIIPGFSRCIRPCPGTNTGFLHYESLDNISAPLEESIRFIKEIGYSGLFSIEFLRDLEGKDFFLEMNFRNDGNAICVTSSGTNLPYLWYLANTGGDYKSELAKCMFKPVYVMPEFPDFESFVYSRKISVLHWLKDVSHTNTFMVFNRCDLRPFWYEFYHRFMKKLIKRIFK